jgi:DNA-binding Lrp family transcriptional regulator
MTTTENTNPAPALRVVEPGEGTQILTSRNQPAKLRTSWTAADLMAMEFPPPKWAVPGIVAEGISLLAGPPKVGKSWLSLGLGLSVASGTKAFDAIPVPGGPVLYLALEDTPRRLQTRMGRILGGQPAPDTLTLATACPPLPQGGDEAIAGWLDRNPDARMVVIDVFAKIRGTSPPGMSAYDADYAAITRIKRVADTYAVAIVCVHHVRKAGSDDFLTEVSGTNGLAGAADTTLVLKRPRGQADGILHVTGRDVDEAEYALDFNSDAGAWHLLDGPPDEHKLGNTRAAILRWLRTNGPAGPKAIANGTGIPIETVKKTCQRMHADSQLTSNGARQYHAPGDSTAAVPNVPGVPNTGPTYERAGGQQGQVRGSGSGHGVVSEEGAAP